MKPSDWKPSEGHVGASSRETWTCCGETYDVTRWRALNVKRIIGPSGEYLLGCPNCGTPHPEAHQIRLMRNGIDRTQPPPRKKVEAAKGSIEA